jgi:hypothetical protein
MLKLHLIVDKTGLTQDTLRPRARIAIEYSGGVENNTQFVSPDCLIYNEVEHQLNKIEKNLKQLRSEAKSAFKDTPWKATST